MGQDRNKETKDFWEFNENEYIACPNFWESMKEASLSSTNINKLDR